MTWKYETYSKWNARVQEWHPVFAWFPVSCGENEVRAWLQVVERRSWIIIFGEAQWEYRLKETKS